MTTELVDEIHATLVPNGHPLMTGPFRPNYQEFNASDMEVIGEIPNPWALTTCLMAMACCT